MSKKLYPEEDIQNIANAIRTLNGSSDSYTVSEMASAIELPENAYYLKSASGNPINITDGEELKCQSALVTFAPKQSGTGEPSPENIRPISGWDGLSLARTGKNLFDKTAKSTSKGYVDNRYLNNTGNTIQPGSGSWYISEYIRIYSTLSLSGLPTSDATNPAYCFYTKDKIYISGVSYSNREKIDDITIPQNAYYLRISVLIANADIIQVEMNTTATSYEPYNGQTHTATFPSTIMGGSYDFVSGEGTANLSDKVDLGSLTWSYDSNGHRFYSAVLTDMKNTEGWNNLIFYSESYKKGEPKYDGTGGDNTIGLGNQRIYIRNTQYTNATAFKTAMTGYHVCYELATPTPISLQPADVNLLKGSNTVWTDGDTVQLEYWSKSNTVPLLNMLSMGKMNISNINNENNGNEVEEIPVEESKESLEEIENIDNSEK